MTLKTFVNTHRHLLNMTRKEFCYQSGFNHTAFYRIEAGECENPKLSILRGVAAAFKVSPAFIVRNLD